MKIKAEFRDEELSIEDILAQLVRRQQSRIEDLKFALELIATWNSDDESLDDPAAIARAALRNMATR